MQSGSRYALGIALVLLAAICSTGGCTNTNVVTAGGGGGSGPSGPGAGKIGQKCDGACSGQPGYDCAIPSPDSCGGGWCLVDIKTTGSLRQYCTVDCSKDACPVGYHCGEVDVIGIDGIQKACIADEASCGDGILQLGEICEPGEKSGAGTCRDDCSGFDGSCGDGQLQAGEECEADTKDAYCVKCKLVKPNAQVAATTKMTAENWGPQVVTHNGSTSGKKALPTAGDAQGCGAVRVTENTAELVRLEITDCSSATSTRGTWTVAVPRTPMTLPSTPPDKYKPTAKLEQIVGSSTISYPSIAKFSAQTVAGPDRTIVASYDVELVYFAVGGGGRANLTLQLSLLPPTPP